MSRRDAGITRQTQHGANSGYCACLFSLSRLASLVSLVSLCLSLSRPRFFHRALCLSLSLCPSLLCLWTLSHPPCLCTSLTSYEPLLFEPTDASCHLLSSVCDMPRGQNERGTMPSFQLSSEASSFTAGTYRYRNYRCIVCSGREAEKNDDQQWDNDGDAAGYDGES